MHTTQLEGGIVSSRVALLLRSAEIKPLFFDLKFSMPSNIEGTFTFFSQGFSDFFPAIICEMLPK